MSRSRKGTSSSPSGGNSQLQSELEELRTATRRAHEVLAQIKDERRGLAEDKRNLSLLKTQLDASIKEVKSFMEGEAQVLVSTALATYMRGGRIIIDEAAAELETMMETFRKAKNLILTRAGEDLEVRAEELRQLSKEDTKKASAEKIANNRVEIIVLGLDDEDDNPVPSTFGNGR